MNQNILFIVIDSLNATKCFNKNKTSKTPNIDSLCKTGTVFDKNINSSPVSNPAISTMFTSRYPFECMVNDNDIFVIKPKLNNFLEEFRKHGYTTHAIFQDVLLPMGMKKIFKHVNPYSSKQKLWHGLGDKILNELNSDLKTPWFFYLQIYDLQWLLFSDDIRFKEGPSELLSDEYGKNQYERIVSSIDVWIGKFLEKIDLDNTLVILTADHGTINANFTKELEDYNQNFNTRQSTTLKIAQKATSKTPGILKPLKKKVSNYYLKNKTDSKKKNIENELNKLDSQNITPYEKRIKRTILLGESNVYDERFCVPLIFTGSGVPSGKTIPYQVRSVDIFPTIADIVGIPQIDNIRGKSLIPMFNDEENNDRPAFIESATNSPKSKSSDVVGIRTPTHKYFRDRNDSSKKIHLYDLKNDPLEEYNIANDNSEIIEKMEKMLQDIQGENGFRFGEANALTKEESEDAIKVLKELGYL